MAIARVYGIRSKNTTDYFYIGSTKHSLEIRLKGHIDAIKRGNNKNRHFTNKVKRVGIENLVIELIEECAEEIRFIREYEIIGEYLRRGISLTNKVVSARDFELHRANEEWDNFQLTPFHVVSIVSALESGVPKNGDKLHDAFAGLVEVLAQRIMDVYLEEFKQNIPEIMAIHYDKHEADRQTASLYKRISALLERNKGGS